MDSGISHARSAEAYRLAQGWWAPSTAAAHTDRLTRGVRAPLRQPGLHDDLNSWYLAPGFLDKGVAGFDSELFSACFAFLRELRFDARYDRSHGLHGRLVLHSLTTHPRPYRIEFGSCHGSGRADDGQPCSCLVFVDFGACRCVYVQYFCHGFLGSGSMCACASMQRSCVQVRKSTDNI